MRCTTLRHRAKSESLGFAQSWTKNLEVMTPILTNGQIERSFVGMLKWLPSNWSEVEWMDPRNAVKLFFSPLLVCNAQKIYSIIMGMLGSFGIILIVHRFHFWFWKRSCFPKFFGLVDWTASTIYIVVLSKNTWLFMWALATIYFSFQVNLYNAQHDLGCLTI